jgi:hypothetical protein
LYNDLIDKKVQGEASGEFGKEFFELLRTKWVAFYSEW